MPGYQLNRRTLLTATMGAAASVVALGSLHPAQAAAGLPMTVYNRTGRFRDDEVFFYVVGTDLATGQQGFVRADGAFRPCALSDNGPDGFADLSIPIGAGGSTSMTLPQMSGRVYVSIQQRLRFRVLLDGAGRPALQYPAGWVSGDPSFSVLHDCAEFTNNATGMFCNTTAVDMFSIPLEIQLSGSQVQTTGGLVGGGRDAVFAGIAAVPEFSRLIVGDNLRVIAPGHGLDAGLFPANYLDPLINDAWTTYAGTDLRVRTGDRSVTGRVVGDALTFDGGVRPVSRPSTRDVLFCDGALAAPNDGVSGPVAAVLGAALNRSTLPDVPDQPTTSADTFYRRPITNHYSRVVHAAHRDGKAYGFAFDDVADFASYVQDLAPTRFELTVGSFS
jgi:glycosyl hydrolase family 64 (putative beta-1,3-glucanase)